jgi:predicted translin family RNA/ssDNA-binding protein
MSEQPASHPVSRLEAHAKETYEPKNDIEKLKAQVVDKVSKADVAVIQDSLSSMKNDVEKLKTHIDKIPKIDTAPINDSISSMKNDIEKIKAHVVDKVPKAVLAELESKLNNHSKSIDSFSKKLYELQNNLNAFTQQPVTQIMIETIRKQVTEEIMANVTSMFEEHVKKTNTAVETKHDELKSILQNTKRFVFHK